MTTSNTQAPRILMLGPDLSVRGGMANVEKMFLAYWQHDQFAVRHIPMYIEGSKFAKLLLLLRSIAAFITALIVWRPAIVHIHFSKFAGYYRESLFGVAARAAGVRVILHCHSQFDEFYDSQPRWLQAYIRYSLAQAHLLIVLSQRWNAYFSDLLKHDRIEILNNPIEIPPADTPNHAVGDGQAQPPVILTLGVLEKAKGTYDLLDAIPAVLAEHPDTQFWFGGNWMGGEQEREAAEALVAQLPWCEHVRLLGWVTGETQREVWRACTIFLLPSYAEAMPLVVLEAMARSLPVITTRVGGLPDLITHDENGYFVTVGAVDELSQSINRLLSDSDHAARLGQAGRQTVEQRFDVNVVLADLYRIYRQQK